MKFNRRDIFKTFFGGAIAPGVVKRLGSPLAAPALPEIVVEVKRELVKPQFPMFTSYNMTFTRNIGVGDYKRDAGDKAV